MAACPETRHECEIVHRFTPGLYSRSCLIPAGALVTSKIHLTRHQFVVLTGDISVFTSEGVQRITAPYHGITEPGTRRVLFAHADTVWTTFHATAKTTPEEVEAEVIHPHTPGVPLLEENR